MDIDAMFVLVPAAVFGVLAAYYAMKFAAERRYRREEAAEAEARAERERRRREKNQDRA
jgi:hypothetical protein